MKNQTCTKVPRRYLENIERKVKDLKILTEISAVISSTLDFNALIALVMEKAKDVMEAEACSILIYNAETRKLEFEIALSREDTTSEILKRKVTLDLGQGIAGWVAQHQKLLLIRDTKKDNRFYQEADKLTGFVTKRIIAAPLIGRRGLIGVAEIINPKREDYDMEILQLLMRHFAVSIENAIFYRESIERERMKQELAFASVLQQSFLPEKPYFQKKNITVKAVNIPAKQIGGDFYDFIEPFSGNLGVFVGDISGKGVSAALYMAKMISEFRYSARRVKTPEKVMKRLNASLVKAPRGMFLTGLYLIIGSSGGNVLVANAGHPPALLVRKRGVKLVGESTGPPLGMIENDYSVHSFTLHKSDRVVLVTDGVFEAKNKKGERLGFDSFVQFVIDHRKTEDLTDVLLQYVKSFSKGVEQTDDITIAEIRFQ